MTGTGLNDSTIVDVVERTNDETASKFRPYTADKDIREYERALKKIQEGEIDY